MRTINVLDNNPELVGKLQSGGLSHDEEYKLSSDFIKKEGRMFAAMSIVTDTYPECEGYRKTSARYSLIYRILLFAAVIFVMLLAFGLIKGKFGTAQIIFLCAAVVLGAAAIPLYYKVRRVTVENFIVKVKSYYKPFDFDAATTACKDLDLDRFEVPMVRVIYSADGRQRAIVFEDASLRYEELSFYSEEELEQAKEKGSDRVGSWISNKDWSDKGESVEDAIAKAAEWIAL